mgnify:CR=1 FL=1
MSVDIQTVKRVARLARIAVSEDDAARMTGVVEHLGHGRCLSAGQNLHLLPGLDSPGGDSAPAHAPALTRGRRLSTLSAPPHRNTDGPLGPTDAGVPLRATPGERCERARPGGHPGGDDHAFHGGRRRWRGATAPDRTDRKVGNTRRDCRCGDLVVLRPVELRDRAGDRRRRRVRSAIAAATVCGTTTSRTSRSER